MLIKHINLHGFGLKKLQNMACTDGATLQNHKKKTEDLQRTISAVHVTSVERLLAIAGSITSLRGAHLVPWSPRHVKSSSLITVSVDMTVMAVPPISCY